MDNCLTESDFVRYAAEDVSVSDRRRFDAHLAECEHCRSAFEVHRRNDDFLAEAAPALADLRDSQSTIGIPRPQRLASRTRFPEIEDYEIIGVAGRGGMGIVYEAVQKSLNRKVALKVLPALIGAASPESVTRFRREASAAAKLHHTNIIPIYASGEAKDGYFYAMELVDGHSLDVIIRRLATNDAPATSATRIAEVLQAEPSDDDISAGVRDATPASEVVLSAPSQESESDDYSGSSSGHGKVYFQQVAHWMADVADALHYAHKQGIIHRDIKPSNLILARDGRLMIGDFGLAKQPDDQSMTKTGALVGTLRYMSPEQAMARRMHVDHRTDIYSLGATMYELLTFQPAVGGSDEKEILGQIVTANPILPRKLNSSTPRELQTICLKSMEKATKDRYQTAQELAADLRRYINDLPLIAKPPGPMTRCFKFVKRHRAASVAVTAIAMVLFISAYAAREVRAKRTAQADRLVTEGWKLLAEGKLQQAEETFSEALDVKTDYARAMCSMANLKRLQFNEGGTPALLDQALELCRQASQLNPQDGYAWNLMGVILKMQQRYDEAARIYEKAIRLQPAYPPTWVNKATAQVLNGDWTQAEATLEHAVQLANDSPNQQMQFVDAWRNLGALQMQLGRPDTLDTLQASRKFNPDDAATWTQLARLYLTVEGVRDYAAATEAAIAAKTRDENDPRTRRILALAYLRQDQFAQAIEQAGVAVDLGDMPAINHLIMAIAEARRNNVDAARTHYDAAIQAWPADLETAGTIATADKGVLWFETADELARLRREAEASLNPAKPQ